MSFRRTSTFSIMPLIPLDSVPSEISKLAQAQQLIGQMTTLNDKQAIEKIIDIVTGILSSTLTKGEEWKFVFDEIRHLSRIRDPLLFVTFFDRMKKSYLKFSDQEAIKHYEELFNDMQNQLINEEDANVIGFDITLFLNSLKKEEEDAEMRKLYGYLTMNLMDAIKEDNDNVLLQLISQTEILDKPDNSKEKELILCFCAFYGSIKCFKTLLLQGFEITNNVEKCACASGNFSIISYLSNYGCQFNNCLQVAAFYRRDTVFMWLIQQRAPTLKELNETINMEIGKGLYIPAACFLATTYNLALKYQSDAIIGSLVKSITSQYTIIHQLTYEDKIEKMKKAFEKLKAPLSSKCLKSRRNNDIEPQILTFSGFKSF